MVRSRPDDPTLSRRELEVARAYTAGKTYRQIADDLHIAPATVRTHINNIYRKLDVSSKIELLHRIEPFAGDPNTRSLFRPVTIGLTLIAATALTAFTLWPSSATQSAPLPEMRSMALVVFVDRGDPASRDQLARDLIEGLTQHLALFVIEPGEASRALSPETYAQQLSGNLNVRFVLSGSAGRDGALWRVSSSLFDREADRVIWSDVFRGARPNGLSLRPALITSIQQAVRLPAAGQPTARCLELTEHLAQAGSGSPVTKIYQFRARGPRYCPGDTAGPR